MRTVSDLIRQSDPLSHEPIWSPQVRQGVRQKVLQGCRGVAAVDPAVSTALGGCVLTMCLVFVAAAAIIPRVWEPPVQAQASVRFEIRLAEDSPAPGLQPVKRSGPNDLPSSRPRHRQHRHRNRTSRDRGPGGV